MYQNMLRNQMTPLGWTLNLELGTGQLVRCWCWAPKVLDTVYWADVELLKRSFSRRNWSPSVSCGRFSAPTVTLTRPNRHHSHFHPHLSLFFDTFYCCYVIVGYTNFGWVIASSTSLSVYFYCAFQSHHHLQSFIPHCSLSWILYLYLQCICSECSRSPLPLVLWIDQESFTNHFLSWLSNS